MVGNVLFLYTQRPTFDPKHPLLEKSQTRRHALGITGMGGRDKQIRSVNAPASRVKVDVA